MTSGCVSSIIIDTQSPETLLPIPESQILIFKRPPLPCSRFSEQPHSKGSASSLYTITRQRLYINPDEIEKEICEYDFLDFRNYQLKVTEEEVIDFFSTLHF